jgi:alkyldihydroxyacetonephosphate synthase
MVADTFETACTWDAFDSLHTAVIRAVTDVMKRVCGAGVLSCRLTHVYPDGPAPYFTFIAPGTHGALLEPWAEIKRAASEAVIANGGTITHHHAVGRTHRPWYDRQRPELFARSLAAVKRELDPAWVMNPGVLLDE